MNLSLIITLVIGGIIIGLISYLILSVNKKEKKLVKNLKNLLERYGPSKAISKFTLDNAEDLSWGPLKYLEIIKPYLKSYDEDLGKLHQIESRCGFKDLKIQKLELIIEELEKEKSKLIQNNLDEQIEYLGIIGGYSDRVKGMQEEIERLKNRKMVVNYYFKSK